MGKYTVNYERTIWVRKYETLKIGVMREFDTNECPMEIALLEVERFVNLEIINRRKELRADRSK